MVADFSFFRVTGENKGRPVEEFVGVYIEEYVE